MVNIQLLENGVNIEVTDVQKTALKVDFYTSRLGLQFTRDNTNAKNVNIETPCYTIVTYGAKRLFQPVPLDQIEWFDDSGTSLGIFTTIADIDSNISEYFIEGLIAAGKPPRKYYMDNVKCVYNGSLYRKAHAVQNIADPTIIFLYTAQGNPLGITWNVADDPNQCDLNSLWITESEV